MPRACCAAGSDLAPQHPFQAIESCQCMQDVIVALWGVSAHVGVFAFFLPGLPPCCFGRHSAVAGKSKSSVVSLDCLLGACKQ